MIVYSAGPAIFTGAKALEIYAEHVRHGEISNIQVLSPITTAVATGRCPQDTAYSIYKANLDLIDKADAVIADISPFRGPSIDPGTAFEIGYAIAQGKSVYAYTSNMSEYASRVTATDEYPTVEDFDLIDNLMVTSALVSISESFEEALTIFQMNYRCK